MCDILGEVAFIAGIILNLWALLSPTPWGSNAPSTGLLKFTPYNEPVGYIAPNPCLSSPLSNATVSIAYGGVSNAANYSKVAVWLGPLGSCSRDQDGAVYCTKPSYSSPVYNMTHVQPNSIYFPDAMQDNIESSFVLGFTIVHIIFFALFELFSLPFWFPGIAARHFDITDGACTFLWMIFIASLFCTAGLTEFCVNFVTKPKHLHSYNSIDNFYLPAPCGQTRELKSGILLKASPGKMFNMMWVAWVLIYAIAGILFVCRMKWMDERYDNHVKELIAAHARSDAENAAIEERRAAAEEQRDAIERREREEKTFRAKVQKEIEKEKETNRVRELESKAKSAVEDKMGNVDTLSIGEAAPLYIELAPSPSTI